MPQTQLITSGFTMVPNKVLLDPTLSAKALKLFAFLEHHSGNNRTCWVGYPLLAEEVGCSVKWLPVLIKKLVEASYLHVEYRQGQSNIYTLLLRVDRRVATHEQAKLQPKKSTEYKQKQPTKTNDSRAYRPIRSNNGGGIDFTKYEKGGVYEKFTRPVGY